MEETLVIPECSRAHPSIGGPQFGAAVTEIGRAHV